MDRFFRGFTAGMIAGIVLNVYNLICYYILEVVEIRYIDWTSILLFGHRPENLHAIILNLVFQLLWDGFLGVIFAYLITFISSRGYYIKGVLYATLLIFIFRTIVELFRVPFLTNKFTLVTFQVNFLGTLFWGLILAYILKKLSKNDLGKSTRL